MGFFVSPLSYSWLFNYLYENNAYSMSDSKIIVNKHFRNTSEITEDVFTTGGTMSGYFAEGEIVIGSNPDDPGLYIMTGVPNHNSHGKVVKITGAENIRLSSAYTESTGSGEETVVHSGDTIESAIGKVVKQVKDATEHVMPNVGDGLIVQDDTLKVNFDPNTLGINEHNKLTVIGGGSGSSDAVYMSQATYDALVESGEVDPNKTYFTWEDDE